MKWSCLSSSIFEEVTNIMFRFVKYPEYDLKVQNHLKDQVTMVEEMPILKDIFVVNSLAQLVCGKLNLNNHFTFGDR